ncbi:DNA-3-methyladenine glycosylase family protein [Fictibacillus gelatini]|uniref:DNA-3-methyladenine glycosylase family protein n=1 Tax=Fictibacillus gelatini TaxID=225985 RepID=UPI0004031FB6|nr:DNA-3-methyladenine glycosylase 2 [Fictibacillus gelatini]
MDWIDRGTSIEIIPPSEFDFKECLVYLERSDREVMHQVRNGFLYKLIKANQEPVLLKIGKSSDAIHVEFPANYPSSKSRREIAAYVWELFDLERDLTPFYEMASRDKVLHTLIDKYHGLRIIRIPDLFEALAWAIIGQQINLAFAYTLKKRFVEQYGEKLAYKGFDFWLFPDAQTIASLETDDLKGLQFSARKAEYMIGVAKEMASGKLSKESLLQKNDLGEMQKALIAIRGIGAWTADYCIMKCLNSTAAFPISDVGLHNALKMQLGMNRKPAIEEIKEIAANWKGWEAYATFYLWRSLYDEGL